jgi:hypothetical protein
MIGKRLARIREGELFFQEAEAGMYLSPRHVTTPCWWVSQALLEQSGATAMSSRQERPPYYYSNAS